MKVIRIKNILAQNWPIGIFHHCVRTLSWFVPTMSTLLYIPTVILEGNCCDTRQPILKLSFSEKATKIWKNYPLVLTLLSKNSCFVKKSGRFFQILWPSHNFLTLPYFSTFMNFIPDSVSANTTLAYFNGFRLSKADVFSWNPFKKTSVYLVETSAEPGKDINDFWRGKFPINKHCLFVCLFACLISDLEHFKCLCIYGCIFKQTFSWIPVEF